MEPSQPDRVHVVAVAGEKPKPLRGLEVDHRLEFGRLNVRKAVRLFTSEKSVNVADDAGTPCRFGTSTINFLALQQLRWFKCNLLNLHHRIVRAAWILKLTLTY